MLDLTTFAGFVAMISLTIAGNLMLKLGAEVPLSDRIFLGLLGWRSAAGLALFGCGGIVYALLLRRVPLNLAQVFAAMQFVGVAVAASVVLGESISPLRWIGIAFICCGIALAGLTTYGG
jgi:drug/metabolite transporter (DMT)-like permease